MSEPEEDDALVSEPEEDDALFKAIKKVFDLLEWATEKLFRAGLYVIAALIFVIPLAVLYALVRFVKWAWEN